ncbi:hypothetical protein ACQ4LE_000331 [Meloidogyne hapla]|uniref:ER membrane protein complex subunit 10 n=1 Tax=Meloidogyne hapla TaxID=6305 RepID=A0A1I8BUR2_MELHA
MLPLIIYNFLHLIFLLFILHFTSAFREFSVPLEYAIEDIYFQIGQIRIKPFVGSYNVENILPATAEFIASSKDVIAQWRKDLEANPLKKEYKMRSGQIFSSNSVKGYIQSKYVHLLIISADLDNQRIHSLTHFPAPMSMLNNSTVKQINERSPSPLIIFRVQGIVDLPGPDTATYLRRLEEEKRARQQGTQDNRSFLQKYWIYFVPVIVFMVLSNVLNPEPQGAE